mmetsp:Transcript_5883/g.7631  ORF Transcript_5883/g.7631 Transcript_5883/m.7631 type:complete len:621 (-) Transcript_5883:46-1908(-)
MLNLGTSSKNNGVKVSLLLLGNVSSLEGTSTTLHGGNSIVLVKVLTREDKGSGSLLAGDGRHESGNSLLGIGRPVNINIGDHTKTTYGLNRLMGRTVLTNSDGVVGKNPGDTAELGKTGNTDGGAEVVNEHKEGGTRSLEDSVVSNTVKDGSHGVLTDSEVQVLSSVVLVKSSTEVSGSVNVVTGRSVKIGRSRDVVGNKLGNLLDNLVSGNTGGLSTSVKLRDGGNHVISRHDIVGNGILKLLGHVRVGLRPGLVGGLPFVVGGLVLGLNLTEVVASSLRNEPLLALRKTDVLLGVVNVWDTSLSVGSVGSLSLLHTLSDDGVALDELGLAVVGGLGSSDGLLDNSEVVSINVIDLPSVSLVTLKDILRLGVFSHLVKGDLVGIVEDDEVVELLVSGEGGGLSGDTLLEASISGKSVDVVVEDGVLLSVVLSSSHLLGNGESNSVGNTLSKRTGGALNSGGVVLGVGEFGVTRGHGVVLTEVLDLFHGKVEASKVEPGVKEHGSVSSRKDETVTVHPLGVLGVVGHLGSIKTGSDLGGTEGKTHVTRMCGSDGVHSKTTGLVGSGGECCHFVRLDLSGLEHSALTNSEGTRGGHLGSGETVHPGGKGRGGNSEHGELHC